jgi:hypothetical protein
VADRVIKIITPAETYDLITLDEIKLLMGIPDTDTSQDEVLQSYITQYSDVVATICNRVFAYEEVTEIWRCTNYDDTNAMKRLFVSHYPIDADATLTIQSPTGTALDPASYEIEEKSGKIELLGTCSEPISVTYSGGYELPNGAPPALKQATILMVREGQALMNRLAVSGIRSISHKDSRVMYFDSTTMANKALFSGSAMSGLLGGAANSLLMHYIRLEV